jgi:hypothetical protein
MRLTSFKCCYTDPDLPCDYCARHNLECGTKDLATPRYIHTGRDEGHQYAAPAPRSPSGGRSPGASRRVSFLDQHQPVSWRRQPRLSAIVTRLESQHPSMDMFEIFGLVRREIANLHASSSSPQRQAQSRGSFSAHHIPPTLANAHAQSPNPPFLNSTSNAGGQEQQPSLQNLTIPQDHRRTTSSLFSGPTTSNLSERPHSQRQLSIFQQQQRPQASSGRGVFSNPSNDPMELGQFYQAHQSPTGSSPSPQNSEASSPNNTDYNDNTQNQQP